MSCAAGGAVSVPAGRVAEASPPAAEVHDRRSMPPVMLLDIVMAYVVMAYIVMAGQCRLSCWRT